MATSKTLTPTNVTIQIPAMSDAPNASVFANCVDKLADAINALGFKSLTASKASGVSSITIGARRCGRVCIVSGTMDFDSAPQAWTNYDVATIVDGSTPINSAINVYGLVFGNSGKIATIEITANTNKLVFRPLGNTGYTDTNGRFELVYPIA